MAFEVDFTPDMKETTKSLRLTLSSGAGSIPISDSATLIGLRPTTSVAIRVGLTTPEAAGTATGAAAAADLKKGFPLLDAGQWIWIGIGPGKDRTLSFVGGASDVVDYVELP